MRSPHTFNQVFARLGFAVVFLAMACLIGRAELGEHDPTWTAPARAARRTNPLAGRLDAAPGGRKLFHERCATCHGDDARGSKKGPDLTAADVQAQSDGALFWKITQGNTRGGMPSFSFLPEPQRWQLVLHVRAHWASSPERSSEPVHEEMEERVGARNQRRDGERDVEKPDTPDTTRPHCGRPMLK